MLVRLTVVVPWVNCGPWIDECLARLQAQSCRDTLEIVVYTRFSVEEAAPLTGRFPRVRFESGLDGLSIPALRWRGMGEAAADYVALIEDHCLPAADWATRIIDSHAAGYDVVAGPIENASRNTIFDWAFFLLEYANVMPSTEPGGPRAIAGGNVSYRKAVLPIDEERFGRLWEGFLLDRLVDNGAKFLVDPKIAVEHLNPFRFGEFAVQKFLYARSFAAMRAQGWGKGKRLLYAAAAGCVLPLMLPTRLVRAVLRKRRHRGTMLAAFPIIVVLITCGIASEIKGYLVGDGGSLARVR